MIRRDIDLEMAMRCTPPLGSVVEGVWKRKESLLKRTVGGPVSLAQNKISVKASQRSRKNDDKGSGFADNGP